MGGFVVKQSDSIYSLKFSAYLDQDWYLYSQEEVKAEVAPLATEFSYETYNNNVLVIGNTEEPKVVPVYDSIFKAKVKSFKDQVEFIQAIKVIAPGNNQVITEILFSVCNSEKCLPPQVQTFSFDLDQEKITEGLANVASSDIDKEQSSALDLALKEGEEGRKTADKEKDLLNLFAMGFVGGLLALLTPCVFPMIPLTVSFFTKNNSRKKAVVYALLFGLFIFLIYLLLSLPFHIMDSLDPELFNQVSTNPILNIVFFIIFTFFAFSFFGFYQLTLPYSWSRNLDRGSSKFGGALGVFFMAMTLAIVSFSCTGSILGSLLGSSLVQSSGAMNLSFGIGGFGLALAIPFCLWGLFPRWLDSLPKSGQWLVTLKVVLGFIELALAFKFLSNADLVQQWGILKREVIISIWAVVFLAMALYLFGILKFPHEETTIKIGRPRMILGTLVLLFVGYLFLGLTSPQKINLKLLSGFLPPTFYTFNNGKQGASNDLTIYKDFWEGVEAAKISKKPIMIDFTGWACVNCRKMEEQVWTDPEVFKILRDDYIIVSFYVDDRTELPPNSQFTYMTHTGKKKRIETVGDKWSTFQTINFRNNSQPFYALLHYDMFSLNSPVGYTPNPKKYHQWLLEGINEFENGPTINELIKCIKKCHKGTVLYFINNFDKYLYFEKMKRGSFHNTPKSPSIGYQWTAVFFISPAKWVQL